MHCAYIGKLIDVFKPILLDTVRKLIHVFILSLLGSELT